MMATEELCDLACSKFWVVNCCTKNTLLKGAQPEHRLGLGIWLQVNRFDLLD